MPARSSVLTDGRPGRIRLEVIPDYAAKTLQSFVLRNTEASATALTDGFSAHRNLEGRTHRRMVIGTMDAHELLPWIHRVFSNLKRLALGVYHGLRRRHIQAYLDEFAFRWNRRRHTRYAFDSLLGIGLKARPMTYRALVEGTTCWTH